MSIIEVYTLEVGELHRNTTGYDPNHQSTHINTTNNGPGVVRGLCPRSLLQPFLHMTNSIPTLGHQENVTVSRLTVCQQHYDYPIQQVVGCLYTINLFYHAHWRRSSIGKVLLRRVSNTHGNLHIGLWTRKSPHDGMS